MTLPPLEVRLLGGVEVLLDGRPVSLPGRRVTALVAMLALSAGHVVSIDRLAAGLWDEDPPERVRGSLQTYVGRLRRLIGDERVHTSPHGYALRIDRDDVDALKFVHRVETSRAAAGPEAEREAIEAALRLWRGDPFGQAPSDWLDRHEAAPLTERYLAAIERRTDLEVELGVAAPSAAELRPLVERHPLRETLWARLLRVLEATGRRAEALERYEQLRTQLADELGADPAPELKAIHLRLLGDTEPSPAAVIAPGPVTTVPHRLPHAIPGFTGRQQQLRRLDALVRPDLDAPRPGVVALHGPGGAGKTTLALEWAHRAKSSFPDGQVFLDLRGYGPGDPVNPRAALDLLLRALGLPGSEIPADLTVRSALLRDRLDGRRVLVLLDNARDSEQVRPLLPGGDCLLLVTTRSQLRSLAAREGAHRIAVDAMTAQESLELLTHRLTPAGSDEDGATRERELGELAELCGHLPVALAIAGERAGRHEGRSLGTLVDQLRDSRARLAALTAWEDDPLTNVRAVFDWSYDTLAPEAASMLRHLGMHPNGYLDVGAAAAAAGIDDAAAERLLDRLCDGHLLGEARPGWYVMHDLIHVYAAQLALEVDSDEERDAALRRLRGWYLHSAIDARTQLTQEPDGVRVGRPEPGTAPHHSPDARSAMEWFADHHGALFSIASEARAAGQHRTAYQVALVLSTYLTLIASADAVPLYLQAEASARAADDRFGQAVCANVLGSFHGRSGNLESALPCFERALRLYQEAGEEGGQINARINLSLALDMLGQADRSIEIAERALADARRLGHELQQAQLLNNLSGMYLRVDRVPEALDAAERAVTFARTNRDAFLHAGTTDTLGDAQISAGQPDRAVETLHEALELYDEIGHTSNAAVTLKKLGRAYRELGRYDEARDAWRRALALLDRIAASDIFEVSREELNSLLAELPARRTSR